MIKKISLILVFLFVISIPITAIAGVSPSPFKFASSNEFDNPILWLLFAPQPEPPKEWMGSDASNPYEIIFTTPNDASGVFQLAFEFDNATVPLSSTCSLTSDGITLSIYGNSGGALKLLYYLNFEFEDGGAIPASALTLLGGTPQLDFGTIFSIKGLTSGEVIKMSLQLTDATGSPVALTSVPEPATMLLLGFGLLGLAGLRRKLQK